MIILPATPADLDPIMHLIAAVVAHMRSQGIEQWDNFYPDRPTFAADLAANSLYVAKSNDTLLGVIALDEQQFDGWKPAPWTITGRILSVHRLAVDPSVQRQGIATRLMDFAEGFARRNDFAAIRLDTHSLNTAALNFYTRRNYRLAGSGQFRKGIFHFFEKAVPQPPRM
jgi:ribosomal protein S18 acetylase RimI-like enzyme